MYDMFAGLSTDEPPTPTGVIVMVVLKGWAESYSLYTCLSKSKVQMSHLAKVQM